MRIQTAISPNYVKTWDVAMAIRELVQNYLDSRKEFGCGGSVSWADGIAHIKDFGPGLELRHLALGLSEKSANAKGQFGEGLKLAMMVLAREDRKIEVWAKGKRIQPVIELNTDLGTDTLTLTVEDLPARMQATHTGTSIKVECTQDELDLAKSYFIEFQRKGHGRTLKIEWVEQGKISLPGGMLYANGTVVGQLEGAKFSYHLNGEDAQKICNRDRQVIDANRVRPMVQGILAATSSTVVMEVLLTQLKLRQESWEISLGIDSWRIPDSSRKVWKRVANRVFGDAAVLTDGDAGTDADAAYRGYSVLTRMPWAWTSVLRTIGMPTSTEAAQSGGVKGKRIAQSSLTSEERETLQRAKALVAKYADSGEIWIVADLNGLTADGSVNGAYDPRHDRIYLTRERLASLRAATGTLLHETAHKVSKCGDCTSGFEAALVEAGLKLLGL
jgi:hypothetical protein